MAHAWKIITDDDDFFVGYHEVIDQFVTPPFPTIEE